MRRYTAAAGLVLVLAIGACASNEETTSPAVTAPAEATAAPSASAAAGTVSTASNAKLGTILVDAQGRTLYTFDKDTGDTIACTGACATRWPPLVVTSGEPTGVPGLATAKRPDGTTQVTFNGKPLYRYSADAKAGDTNGDGFGGVWHVAKPSS